MALGNFSFSQLSPRNQILAFTVIVLGLCGVVYRFYTSPLQADVERLGSEVRQLQREVAEGQALQARLPEFKRNLEEQETRLATLRAALPDQKETSEIIRRIQHLAAESSLELKSFNPQRTIHNGFYIDWPIEMSMEGSYHNLGSFLEKVAGFDRVVNIENLQIEASETQTPPDRTIRATCTATTFVFVDSERSDGAHTGGGRRGARAN